MRLALYARYSTDLQSATSIEDQFYKLKERANMEGWTVAGTYSDAAVSGATLLRPGIQALLQDAAQSRFDMVLAEALDRLSRNQADIARIYEQLNKIVDAVADGAPFALFKDKTAKLEAEKAECEAKLSPISDEPPMLLHPNMSAIYKDKVGRLSDALKADRDDLQAFDAIRSLLDQVVLHPTEDGFEFEVQGELAAILSLSNGKLPSTAGPLGGNGLSRTTKPSELAFEGSVALAEQVKLVAGVGFEPTTFRL